MESPCRTSPSVEQLEESKLASVCADANEDRRLSLTRESQVLSQSRRRLGAWLFRLLALNSWPPCFVYLGSGGAAPRTV